VAEFFFLGLQVFFRQRTGLDFARYALHDLDTGVLQGPDLVRIIRK